ncbi:TonB-dependent receptor [Sessilibacter corallicola]|uniref:TonB-dependent receptor n=1 Tax=Sessilibacter corallicola TaxID=2904075 RepID=UPI001E3E175E|nr:TonB-dependent receptor [Sessilibacter corallicola]MCE2028673.1 TonB-dependent receptor [Sessilibacter corallicola]
MKLFTKKSATCLAISTLCALSTGAFANKAPTIEEILVTAELRDTNLLKQASSVSVYTLADIEKQNATHLEQILHNAPNVNFASGASRGRFIQIRGIGERSEFVEPVNFSVGVLVDGIDFTGISTTVTTLDIDQVEILRGPQGTVYGANALAGLINVKTQSVTDEFSGNVKTTLAEYDTRNIEGVVNLPISDNLGVRVALQKNESDGYIDNTFLNREDTQNIDETVARGTFSWQPNEQLDLDLVLFYADADNGYDSFSLDNGRETQTDDPGHDRQETFATSLTSTWHLANGQRLISSVSRADSNIEYGFDEDWTFVGFCDGLACDEANTGFQLEYSSFDNFIRDNENTAIDVRWLSDEGSVTWLAGVYYRDQQVDLRRVYTFLDNDFLTEYETENTAVYGEISFALNEKLTLTTGARIEQRDADYADNDGVVLDADESDWGGKIALEYNVSDNHFIYGLVSRGFKFGGFNPNNTLEPEQREFDSEELLNYEIGSKGSWFNGRLQSQVSVFYQDREDVQLSATNVVCTDGMDQPCTFSDFVDNATAGNSLGLEAQLNFALNDNINVYSSLGLLESEFEDYVSFSHVDANPEQNIGVDLDGHDLPQAPNYTFTVGTNIQLTNDLNLDVQVQGKDDFFFSNDHEFKADGYELLNMRLEYAAADWEFAVWGRNITDVDYEVRGFGTFSNDPRDFFSEVELYTQLGEPRVLGVSASYQF